MQITRIIALGVIVASIGLSASNAQTLRDAQPPADFPAASYKGKQYVDSRGCIYIRAGIDGNVTWVPRVTRGRKQVCGYKPTQTARVATPAAKPAQAPTVITNTQPPKETARPTAAAPTATAAAKPVAKPSNKPAATAAAPAPRVTTTTRPATAKPSAKPEATVWVNPAPATTTAPAQARPTTTATATTTTGRKPSGKPAATVWVNPAPATTTASTQPRPTTTTSTTTQRRPVAAPAESTTAAAPKDWSTPAPTQATTQAPVNAPAQASGCPNASAFSQQFINKPGARHKVRCGPQAEAPITYGQREDQSSAADLAPDTRVVPRHVYDNRQNTTNVAVPKGYRTVWTDDRLNPHRAERTLQQASVQGVVTVPRGYKLVDWEDNRLNLRRGVRTAQGDAQSDQIWTRTTPRTLIPVSTQARVVTVPASRASAQDSQTNAVRVSTRSAPAAAATSAEAKRWYVRVATYGTETEARATAQALARSGLPMRLGTVKPSGKKVVLAGPFGSNSQAKAALHKVRGAGFRRARLNK